MKNGNRGITQGSLVFCRSKVDGASDEPLLWKIHSRQAYFFVIKAINKYKCQKCSSDGKKRYLHSLELFMATLSPKDGCDSIESLIRSRILSQFARLDKRSKWRVFIISNSG